MPYNQITVILGGLVHIPIIILVLKFIENKLILLQGHVKDVRSV